MSWVVSGEEKLLNTIKRLIGTSKDIENKQKKFCRMFVKVGFLEDTN